ncbi:MAG TPA: IPT/TIG domain-containing protein [Geobacteraceae bacterium]|nr:IPT/TIG domain-containing protein [Geobacteraceae bacterium]
MRYLLTACVIILTLCTLSWGADEDVPQPAILSIIPGQGAPGTTVIISGSGFTAQTTAFLGTDEIRTRLISPRQISFEIPPLAAGNYALYLRQGDDEPGRTYAFTIIPVKPTATSITPDSLSFCASGQERVITVKGKNFQEGAQLLFDGAIIRSSRNSGEEMTFTAPPVPGGLHQVQIKNSEDAYSGTLGFLVTTRPEIRSVSQGANYVNYYNLNIEGTNFQQGSSLIVDGKRLNTGYAIAGERDLLQFVSCTRLVYQRYPYDPSIKSFRIMVTSPNGEESDQVTVSAP